MSDLWAEDEVQVQIERNIDPTKWCDSHRYQYGYKIDKETGERWWHPKAQVMAYWIITSVKHNPGSKRQYCLDCVHDLENIDGTLYPLEKQLADGQETGQFWKLSTRLHTLGDK